MEILERVWWRLDRALDEESVYLSGLVGAIEAARSGTTLLIDHHASPSFVRGSLATSSSGSGRGGPAFGALLRNHGSQRDGGRDEGLEENRAFTSGATPSAERLPRWELTRGLVGAHASFTLSDESLDRLGAVVRDLDSSLHIHVAEDHADVDDSHKRCGAGVVERLRRHGLLRPKTLLVHGVHLDEAELREAQAAGAWMIHCPRSNMNNGVGHARTEAFTRAALGTDGMDEDMLAEARAAFLKMRDAGRADAFDAAFAMLAGGHRLAHALLGLPLGSLDPAQAGEDRLMRAQHGFPVVSVDPAQAGEHRLGRTQLGLPEGSLDPAQGDGQAGFVGVPADLVILDYLPPTPLTAEHLAGHLLFGIDRSHVRSTMVAGRFVLRDRRLTNVDEEAICTRAQAAAERLWERMCQ